MTNAELMEQAWRLMDQAARTGRADVRSDSATFTDEQRQEMRDVLEGFERVAAMFMEAE